MSLMTVALGTVNKPLVIIHSILAGAQVFTGSILLTDLVGEQLGGALILVIASFQAGLAYYTQATTTQNTHVAAKVNGNGEIVAGPAADMPTGFPAEVKAPNGAN